jgi:hypothetical protein
VKDAGNVGDPTAQSDNEALCASTEQGTIH